MTGTSGSFIEPRRGIRIVNEANPSRNGTAFSKPSAGVDSNNAAPVAPPISAAGTSGFRPLACPFNSGLDPRTEPMLLKMSATVLVTLAVTGGNPSASSAG